MQGVSHDPYITLLGSFGGTDDDDINELCRLCTRHCSEDLGYSFDSGSGNKKILHMINACLPINIETTDPYPKKICLDCNNYLQLIFQFRNKAIQAQEMFKLKIPYSNSSPSTMKLGTNSIHKNESKSSRRENIEDDDIDLLEKVGISVDLSAADGAEIGDLRNKRGFTKRRVWSSGEKAVMTKIFSTYLTNGTLPSFHLCAMVRQMNPILLNRSNSTMKAWVYNQHKKQRQRNKITWMPM